jgi:uncharacterized protein YyaL (SSP411 family)
MKFSLILILGVILNTASCNRETTTNDMDSTHQHTNHLINETSPYLLQHAHNPVEWYPWGEEALKKAKDENKLLLISIGYSACHWCHVMEHESFEDTVVAKIMNENFVCIKVDREERPDIDQIYMSAVQLMNQRGGWPLNCFATSDGKPFYGGTYFPKDSWMKILEQLNKEYTNNPQKVIDFANKLTQGVQQSELISVNPNPSNFDMEVLDVMVQNWKPRFDTKEGGPNKAPKFPIPNNYQFLLRYYHATKDKEVLDHVLLTLDKMAQGGIYDQIGGGFARYSTDILWKVPHFEKMLYDNAQLVSLYSEAYQLTKKELYKTVVYETIEFVERELMDKSGAFYSALDADSEDEEGKFYVWTKDELKVLLKDDFELFSKYYNINTKGFWEHGNYILLKDKSDADFIAKENITHEALNRKTKTWKALLLKERENRIRPGLDNKSLTSWNALMLKSLTDAYQVFNDDKFLTLAQKNAAFIVSKQLKAEGQLLHNYKNGTSNINGFLEDYCFTIEAFLGMYQITFDEEWLHKSNKLAKYATKHFYDEASGMFYFTSDDDKGLIARKMELTDNVIPASNSSMAKALFQLGHYFDNNDYNKKAETMLNTIQSQIGNYGAGYSNWGQLMLNNTQPYYEIAICGKDCQKKKQELNKTYLPNKLLLGSNKESILPLLEGKMVTGETRIYVCVNKACQMPTTSIEDALKQIK